MGDSIPASERKLPAEYSRMGEEVWPTNTLMGHSSPRQKII